MPAPARGPDPPNLDVVGHFMGWKWALSVVVAQTAGDYRHTKAALCQRKGEISEQFTRRGVIRIEEAIEEDHAARDVSHETLRSEDGPTLASTVGRALML